MISQQDQVILVNERDESTGTMEKLEAHRTGVLHRAFSVFILDSDGRMLLQQRAEGKYHSGGLWSNTCCSHPGPGEDTVAAAHRRLQEELGFDCSLEPLFHLLYRSYVGNGLIENEYDHIFVGIYDGAIKPNPEEVKSVQYIGIDQLAEWMNREPGAFTQWFHIAMPQFIEKIKNRQPAA